VQRIFKCFLIAIGAAFLAPIVSLLILIVVLDLIEFQPERSRINRLLAEASQSEREPPSSLNSVLSVTHTVNQIANFSVKAVRNPLQNRRYLSDSLGWHPSQILWWCFMRMHYNNDERLALFLSKARMGDVIGFESASMKMFSKPLGFVSLEQAATLLVVSKAPHAFLGNPIRLQNSVTELLKKVQDLK
jgi:Transglycosylase